MPDISTMNTPILARILEWCFRVSQMALLGSEEAVEEDE